MSHKLFSCSFYCLFALLAAASPSAFSAPALRPVPVTNTMLQGRWAPAYALLPGGKRAIVAGGFDYNLGLCVSSVDLYDRATNRFIPSRCRMTYPRDFAIATLLLDGTVLIAGGYNDVLGSMRVAELYDPKSDSFSTTGSMQTPRELFQSTLLADGRVLVTGGLCLASHRTVASGEVYDPVAHTWAYTGNMIDDRFGHAACALPDGGVLVVGGTSLYLSRKHGHSATLASAEIYDPAIGQFSSTGPMLTPRDRPTATLLADGTVLIDGGQGSGGAPVTFDEIYDPKTQQFSKANLPALTPRMAHEASMLPSGDVFISGGWDADAKETTGSAIEIGAAKSVVAPLPALPFASHDQAQVVFPDGSVLVAGGKSVDKGGASTSVAAGALYTPNLRTRF